jgi:hypothetical protein
MGIAEIQPERDVSTIRQKLSLDRGGQGTASTIPLHFGLERHIANSITLIHLPAGAPAVRMHAEGTLAVQET